MYARTDTYRRPNTLRMFWVDPAENGPLNVAPSHVLWSKRLIVKLIRGTRLYRASLFLQYIHRTREVSSRNGSGINLHIGPDSRSCFFCARLLNTTEKPLLQTSSSKRLRRPADKTPYIVSDAQGEQTLAGSSGKVQSIGQLIVSEVQS